MKLLRRTSLLLAQSGHSVTEFRCPLLGVKRTLVGDAAMSAFDPTESPSCLLARYRREQRPMPSVVIQLPLVYC